MFNQDIKRAIAALNQLTQTRKRLAESADKLQSQTSHFSQVIETITLQGFCNHEEQRTTLHH